MPRPVGKSRGALLDDAKWELGRIITISFLDDDTPGALADKVKQAAQQWLTKTGANLRFQWRVDTKATDVRISFKRTGSWSVLGRYALAEQDVGKPTMNFGWLTASSSDADIQQVVLHEFGHALGLIHEHQSPEAMIPWDREAVIRELSGPPNHWTIEDIVRNVLTGYDRSEVTTTPFDPQSIMLYPVPAAWTRDGYETHANRELSEQDVAVVRKIYGLG